MEAPFLFARIGDIVDAALIWIDSGEVKAAAVLE